MSATVNEAPGRENTRDKVVKLRPTMFVGLGGTGKEILLRLRRRILQNDWNGRRISDIARFPIASFVYFDTDTTDAVESDRSRMTDSLARAVAFREAEKLQKQVDIGHYMKELDNYPLIQQWLPEADLSSINTDKGAGQVRAISRLLFFREFRHLSGMMRTQADALMNSIGRQGDLAQIGADIEPQLRVVVVCSAVGGTGSGSFIDVGLMLRSRKPRPAQTDLIMLLPGGFKGANYERVNANAFAALMELEHVMRPNAQPSYVERWTDQEGPEPRMVPYDDVYLVDSRNVLGAGTDKVDEVYDMVADILFEDFGSSDFAARKRSIGVNQQQFKMVNYLPPLSSKFGEKSLSYSCAFSSFGQATIDTKSKVAVDSAVAQACKAMMKAYFNVALDDSGRLPTIEERDQFLREEFHLSSATFDEILEGIDDRATINEPALIARLLQLENDESVVANLATQVMRFYENEVFVSSDVTNWPALALAQFQERATDVRGNIKHEGGFGPAGMLIAANRQRLTQQKRGESDAGLRAQLFRYLDNRVRGGLDYTIHLVTDSKVSIERHIKDLELVEARYAARAEETLKRFERSLENLKEATAERFLRGPDRAAAERYKEHLRTETIYFVTLLLRRQAAKEAQTYLKDMSAELGSVRGLDSEGRQIWDGAIATLVQGRNLVERILRSFDAEIGLLRDAVSRADAGTYVVLPDLDAEAETVLRSSPAEIEEWAASVFKDEGGSRTLFPILEDDAKRAALLNKLRGFVMAQIAPRIGKLRSIHDVLLSMPPSQRIAVFEKAMKRAMPWLNASFSHLVDSIPMADRYKLLVAVEDRRRFLDDFQAELQPLIPGTLGFHTMEVINSGLRDRIILYCEVSGIPLDSIVPLRGEWRNCYRMELQKPFPLHNHKQISRFPSPVVPTNEEIDEIRRTMSLFIRATVFGILRRAPGPEATYQMPIGLGDYIDVGTERDLRNHGFASPSHRVRISEAVEQFENRLSPLQMLAASALMDWTGKRAYASRLVKIGPNQTDRVPGLLQKVALEVAAGYRDRYARMDGAEPPEAAAVIAAHLFDMMLRLTTTIPDSLEDTDAMDANRDPNESAAVRAEAKRKIILAEFTTEALRKRLGAPAPAFPPARPAAPPAHVDVTRGWYMSVKKQVSGPFDIGRITDLAVGGTLTENTHVLEQGTKQWLRVRDVPELVAALIPSPPDDELPEPPED